MNRRGIILMLLTAVIAVCGQCQATEIPASQDVYVSLGTGNETVYNQSDTLLCATNVPDTNNTTLNSYPGVPLIQFNLSGIDIADDDIAILVLKAASVRQMDRSGIVALVTIGSDWDEQSDITTFLVNILPARNLIVKNDLTLMSTNSDGDDIYAFDVSQKLMQAKERGDKVSFLLEAIGNSTTEIDFLSRESGQGPYLMIMPYPGLPISGYADQAIPAGQPVKADQAEPEGILGQMNQTDQILSPDSVSAEPPVHTF
ncbi:hypothetical protein [Methanothrix sp.]|uniref:CBM96 family carbohydrate-binding protein n=1 Tax=Methanothrix sp. TaxID=90426 RepID=UPI00329874CA